MSLFTSAERSPVTAILCVGAIAATVAPAMGRSIDHMVLSPYQALEEPWRFITSIFPHVGWLHLVFNLFWIWQIGRMVEERLGLERMLGFTLLAAVASCGTEVILFSTGVGLSGVVYAVATFAWTRARWDPRYGGIIDDQTKNLLIGWFFLCILLTETGAMRVANGGHAGGAAIGFLLGLRRPWLASVYLVALGGLVVGRLGGALGTPPPSILSHRGVQALQEQENDKAVEIYEALHETGYATKGSLYNHGLGLWRQGRRMESMDWFIRAYELDPEVIDDMTLRAAVIEAKALRDAGR